MDIMNDCFVNFYLDTLRRMGYEAHENNESLAYIYKGDAPSRTYVCTFRNDFNLAFNKESTEEIKAEVFMLGRLRDRLAAPYKKYEVSEPFTACTQENVRKYCDYNNCVLAAQLMGNGELHFITWEYTHDRTSVTLGHYFDTNFEAAQEDFAIRSGLIQRDNVLTKEETEIVRSSCVYRYEHDGDLSTEDWRLLKDTIENFNERKNESAERPTAEKTILSKRRSSPER